MVKLRIGSNMSVGAVGNVRILFSYDTPVACLHQVHGYMKTDKKWSRTTAQHIAKWLRTNPGFSIAYGVQTMPQEYFDALIES